MILYNSTHPENVGVLNLLIVIKNLKQTREKFIPVNFGGENELNRKCGTD